MSKQQTPNLTDRQKATAFDAIMDFLTNSTHDEVTGIVVKIVSKIAETPEQDEDMPPPNLDLSQHVGKTAVLWCGFTGLISKNPFSQEYPYRVAHFEYTKDGFFDEETENVNNIKAILP